MRSIQQQAVALVEVAAALGVDSSSEDWWAVAARAHQISFLARQAYEAAHAAEQQREARSNRQRAQLHAEGCGSVPALDKEGWMRLVERVYGAPVTIVEAAS